MLVLLQIHKFVANIPSPNPPPAWHTVGGPKSRAANKGEHRCQARNPVRFVNVVIENVQKIQSIVCPVVNSGSGDNSNSRCTKRIPPRYTPRTPHKTNPSLGILHAHRIKRIPPEVYSTHIHTQKKPPPRHETISNRHISITIFVALSGRTAIVPINRAPCQGVVADWWIL